MSILQRYVAGELLKTFALAATGLTLVITLCGAMYATMKADVLGTVEILRLLWLIEPVVMTLTLPVSALFACAIVYGRLAADNEFDACRASGINIHRLLAPVVVLSLFLGAFTFALTNYVIPRSAKRFAEQVQVDFAKAAYQALHNKGHIRYKGQVLHAGKVELTKDKGMDVLLAADVAFLDIKNDNLIRCGTARQSRVDFVIDPEMSETVLDAVLYDVRGIDFRQHDQSRLLQQSQVPLVIRVPRIFLDKAQWLTLPQLIYYRRHPTELPSYLSRIAGIRHLARCNLFYRRLCDQLTGPTKKLVLDDDRHRYEIHAEDAWIDEEDFRPEMTKVTVIQKWTDDKGRKRERKYAADAGLITLTHDYTTGRDMVYITLRDNVVFSDSAEPGKHPPHTSQELERVAAPPEMLEGDRNLSDARLLGLNAVEGKAIRTQAELEAALSQEPLNLGRQIERSRMKVLGDLLQQRYKISGILHSRLALSASVLVALLLAAALGIIFRNGQLLTAFVISFLPVLVLVIMNMFGRRFSESVTTHNAGLVIIWAGIGLLTLADGVVLVRYLRR
jgi:lipopolysaccharide export LptBFGC system permease protein LptF